MRMDVISCSKRRTQSAVTERGSDPTWCSFNLEQDIGQYFSSFGLYRSEIKQGRPVVGGR